MTTPIAPAATGTTADQLTISGLTAGYGGLQVLHDVNLQVPAGKVVALLGPNGAGKTTLVKALAGLIRGSGDITLGVHSLGHLSAQKRARAGLTTVTDDRALFRDLSVLENLRIASLLCSRPERSPTSYLSRFTSLTSRQSVRAGLLSGGEQQMLALAKALTARPSFLVLDEPSQGLAPSVLVQVADALRTLKEGHYSALIAEQNLELALSIADQYCVLVGGRIVESGDVKSIDRERVVDHFLSR